MSKTTDAPRLPAGSPQGSRKAPAENTPQPILMSDAMVLALLAGNKTETRRIWSDRYAKVEAGQLLWVREAWRCRSLRGDQARVQYRADESDGFVVLGASDTRPGSRQELPGHLNNPDPHRDAPWQVSMFMPKIASRLTLKVSHVKRQRLREITTVDCMAEGLRGADLVGQYGRLWDSLHHDAPQRWIDNPEVAVVGFEVIKRNILELTKGRKAA